MMNDKASSSEKHESELKTFFCPACFLRNFWCSGVKARKKTCHDKPPKLISMKEGYLHELVFAQFLASSASASWLSLPIHEKHASLVPKKRISDNSTNRFGEQFFTVPHVCCKSHEAIVFKGTFHFVLRALDSYPILGKTTQESCPKLLNPRICFCFRFPMSRSFRRKDETRKALFK